MAVAGWQAARRRRPAKKSPCCGKVRLRRREVPGVRRLCDSECGRIRLTVRGLRGAARTWPQRVGELRGQQQLCNQTVGSSGTVPSRLGGGRDHLRRPRQSSATFPATFLVARGWSIQKHFGRRAERQWCPESLSTSTASTTSLGSPTQPSR